MNYNAPASVPGAFLRPRRRSDGGPVLDNFQQGLYATHDPSDPLHTTVIGHSYGTTVVGEATQAPGGLRADDVVLAASPGINVDNAAAMHVPDGTSHVWATRDDNDPIVWAEGFHNTGPGHPGLRRARVQRRRRPVGAGGRARLLLRPDLPGHGELRADRYGPLQPGDFAAAGEAGSGLVLPDVWGRGAP